MRKIPSLANTAINAGEFSVTRKKHLYNYWATHPVIAIQFGFRDIGATFLYATYMYGHDPIVERDLLPVFNFLKVPADMCEQLVDKRNRDIIVAVPVPSTPKLKVEHLKLVFYFFAACMVASTLVFLLELGVRKCCLKADKAKADVGEKGN